MSSENWIPDETRQRSLYRHIAVAKETLKDIVKREKNAERELKQFKRSDFDKSVALEELQVKKKLPCGCCYQMFSDVNLPLKVSNKAVVDMRRKFSNDKMEVDEAFFVKPMPPRTGKGWWNKIDVMKSNLSRAYDDVSVCAFCSQFFKDQDAYRPSMETVYYEQRKRAYFEQKEREKAYWDPLKLVEEDRIEMERVEEEMKRLASTSAEQEDGSSINQYSNEGHSDDEESLEEAKKKRSLTSSV